MTPEQLTAFRLLMTLIRIVLLSILVTNNLSTVTLKDLQGRLEELNIHEKSFLDNLEVNKYTRGDIP